MSLARALGLDKPHSSVTDWVELLTANTIAEEAYDGIPELVDAINLQASGPSEASRALRKKLKHGNTHQQYRSLVLLKALVENCGTKFQTTFADGQLTDAFKHLISDPYADRKVRKKLVLVLLSWHEQFQNDPYMTLVANLYRQCRADKPISPVYPHVPDIQAIEREEAKRHAREEKERMKREEEEKRIKAKQAKHRPKREPFDFEKEKPKVLACIVEASQASSNLVNAITLVNTDKEKLEDNEKVQECFTKMKQMRKVLVRYIQLVENEEIIGTLIETNDRVNTALQTYEQLIAVESPPSEETSSISTTLAKTHLDNGNTESSGELYKGKERSDAFSSPMSPVHPDLQDLDLGSGSLPPPIRPSNAANRYRAEEDEYDNRGSLSDFSNSSDDGTGTSYKKYAKVSDLSDDDHPKNSKRTVVSDDPFADPN